MRVNRLVNLGRDVAGKIALALLLVWVTPCVHSHSHSHAHASAPGAIDTPISFRNSWDKDCQIHKACKPVEPMPRCSSGLLGSSASRAFTASKDSKDVRSVVGTLRSVVYSCTKADCEIIGRPEIQACCNVRDGGVELVGEDGSAVGLPGEACVGDESRLCCTMDVHGQKIMATGVLVESHHEYGRSPLSFEVPYDVCAL
jgi:hypothetical protein